MEPSAKRPRTGRSPIALPHSDDEYDELNYEPEDVSQLRDPGIQLETSRAFAAHKLKSTWEHIFEKYGKDFTEITDEIDLATGRVITSNGHLENMRHEKDTGIPGDDDEDEGMLLEEAFGSEDGDKEDEDEQADQSDEEDEERILRRKNGRTNSTHTDHRESVEMQPRSSLSQAMPNTGSLGPEHLSSSFATPRRPGSSSFNLSTNIWGSRSETIDPVWDAPEIHQKSLTESLMSKFCNARYRFPSSSRSVWSSRPDDELDRMIMEPPRIDMATFSRARAEYTRSARPASMKLLRAFAAQGDDEEDENDVLCFSIAERPVRIQKKEIVDKQNSDGDNIQEKPLPSVENAQSHEASAEPSSVESCVTRKPVTHPSLEIQQKKIWSVARPKTTPETPAKSQSNADGVSAADTSVEVNFVTEREAEEVKRCKVIIELFSEPPRPGYRNESEDLKDTDTPGLADETPPTQERTDSATLKDGLNALAPLTTGKAVMPDLNREAQSEASTSTGEPPAQILEGSKEMFTRYANDDGFSDAEDAMPQKLSTPKKRERPASPSRKSASPAPVSNGPFSSEFESPKRCLETPPISVREQEDDDCIRSPTSVSVGEAPEVEEISERPISLQWKSCLWESTEGLSTIKSRPVEEPEDQYSEEKHADSDVANSPTEILASSPRSLIATPENLPRLESKEREEDGGFKVIILDDSDESDSSESGLEEEPKSKFNNSWEVMDVELPISQRLNATPQTSPPRHLQIDAQDQRGATSPLGRLNLNPKSPFSTSGDNTFRGHQSARSSRRYPATRHLVSPEPSIQNQPEEILASPAHFPQRPPDYSPRTPQSTPEYSMQSTPQSRTAGQQAFQPHSARKGPSREIVAQRSTTRESTPRPSNPHPPHTSRSRKTRRTPAKSPIRSLASLIPNDEDELTLDTFKSGTKPSSIAFGERKKTTSDSFPLVGRLGDVTTPMKQRRQTAGGSGTGTTTTGKKRKTIWALAATPSKARPVSPSSSLFRTPGGNMRRCGEDGFQCDKSFCFTCL